MYLSPIATELVFFSRFRKKADNSDILPEEVVFNFWVDHFVDACEEESKDAIRFPVSVC